MKVTLNWLKEYVEFDWSAEELAERLTSQSPHLKVIYTSGYSPGMAGKDASLLEGRNFLPKPYSIGKLAQFVRQCLDAPAKREAQPTN